MQPEKKAPFSFKDLFIVKLGSNALGLLLVIIILALAALFFLSYFIVKRSLLLLLFIIRSIFLGIYYFILTIIERIVVLSVTAAIILGVGWWTVSQFPAAKRTFEGALYEIKYTLTHISEVPFMDKITGIFQRKKQEVEAQAASLLAQYGDKVFPKELAPMLDVVQHPRTLEQYGQLLDSGSLGSKGQGAIPLLKNALYSQNANLRRAAHSSLQNIGSKDAMDVIKEYERLVKRAVK